MAALVDLTGQTFGRLIVVERANAPESDTRGKAWWLVRCECGFERAVVGDRLRNGAVIGCGTACVLATGRKPWPRDTRILVGADGSLVGAQGRLLAPFLNRQGYPRVNVYRDGEWSQHSVHVIVCETYHGPRPPGMHAAHEDGVPTNCAADNLSWKTPVENEADKLAHDTRAWGERHGMHKLAEDEVRAIRASNTRTGILAVRYSVSKTTIKDIRSRRNWRHV
jgi:hypothetical protein